MEAQKSNKGWARIKKWQDKKDLELMKKHDQKIYDTWGLVDLERRLKGKVYSDEQLEQLTALAVEGAIAATEDDGFEQDLRELQGIITDQADHASYATVMQQLYNLKEIVGKKTSSYLSHKMNSKGSQVSDYQELSEQQLEQMATMESLAAINRRLGLSKGLILLQINQQTRLVLSYFKYLLASSGQLLKDSCSVDQITDIIEEAIKNNLSGAMILIVYLNGRMKKALESMQQNMLQVQLEMQRIISVLAQKYPPGMGARQPSPAQQQMLDKLEFQLKRQTKDIKVIIQLGEDHSQRRIRLQKAINDRADLATQFEPLLQRLLRRTCSQRAISSSVGVKLKPKATQSVRKRAERRITEKMLFTQSQYQRVQNLALLCGSLADFLKLEEDEYDKKVDEKLSQMQAIDFTVKDMLRGKCALTSVLDIIQTINDIQHYCNQRHDDDHRVSVQKIQSRFGKNPKISDVNIKLRLRKGQREMVAELQLTVQSNTAVYELAHTIYQLERSPIFSKCKMINDMLLSGNDETKQFLSRALLIYEGHPQQNKDYSDLKAELKKLFGLQGDDRIQMPYQALQKALADRVDASDHPLIAHKPLISPQPELQQAVDNLQQKDLKPQEFRRIVQKVLQSKKMSEIPKSVVLEQAFLKMDLAQDIKSGDFVNYEQYISDFLGISGQQLESAWLVNFKLDWYLSWIMKFTTQNQLLKIDQGPQLFRSFIISQPQFEMDQIRFMVHIFDAISRLKNVRQSPLDQLLNIAQESLLQIHIFDRQSQQQLLQQGHLFDLRRLQNATIARRKENLMRDFEHLRTQVVGTQPLRLAQIGLWTIAATLVSAQGEDYGSKTFETYEAQYQKLKALVGNHCQKLEGPYNASAHFLIAEELGKIKQVKLQLSGIIDKARQKHYQKVVKSNMTLQMAIDFRLSTILDEFPGLCQRLKLNENIQQLRYDSYPQVREILSCLTVGWPNLEKVILCRCQIDQKCCKVLAQAPWAKLKVLNLRDNRVGNSGCQFLCTSNWPNFEYLNLSLKDISDEGCLSLTMAKWLNLLALNIQCNRITDEGCKFLCKGQWDKLQSLKLSVNQFGEDGVRYLTEKSSWNYLKFLQLGFCKIGDEGCRHLSQSKWPHLTQLQLYQCEIGQEGCRYLSQGQWPNLSELGLSSNCIDNQGVEYLSYAQWPKLRKLDLLDNKIYRYQRSVLKQFSNQKNLDLML